MIYISKNKRNMQSVVDAGGWAVIPVIAGYWCGLPGGLGVLMDMASRTRHTEKVPDTALRQTPHTTQETRAPNVTRHAPGFGKSKTEHPLPQDGSSLPTFPFCGCLRRLSGFQHEAKELLEGEEKMADKLLARAVEKAASRPVVAAKPEPETDDVAEEVTEKKKRKAEDEQEADDVEVSLAKKEKKERRAKKEKKEVDEKEE